MTDNSAEIKNIIKEALTENYTKENTKIFTLSTQTTDNYLTLQNYLTLFRQKNKENLLTILDDDVALYSSGKEFLGKNNVVEELNSIIEQFNPKNYPIQEIQLSIKLLMSCGGGFPATYNCCPDDPENNKKEDHLFIVPWEHMFSSIVVLKFSNIEDLLNLNHIVKFDDSGKIINIMLYRM